MKATSFSITCDLVGEELVSTSKQEDGLAPKADADDWFAHVLFNVITVASKGVSSTVVVHQCCVGVKRRPTFLH